MFRQDDTLPSWFTRNGYTSLPFPPADSEDFLDEVDIETNHKSIRIDSNSRKNLQWLEFAEILNASDSKQKKYLTDVMGIVSIKVDKKGIEIEMDPVRYRTWMEMFSKEKTTLKSSTRGDTEVTRKSKRKEEEDEPLKKQKTEFVPTLSVSGHRLKKLAIDYTKLLEEQPVNFKDSLAKLKLLTSTIIRNIKKSEVGYLKSNYMVNQTNVKHDLELVVKNNGRLRTENEDQHYDVLVMGNDVIGHLFFYLDKDKNEIKIPAVEVSLKHRGRHFGILFMLSVLEFAQKNGISTIRLETGHHHNAQELKETLTKGMITFYCKLGYRLERIPVEDWNKKDLKEKIDSFNADNESCVFDFSPKATEAAIDEATRTIFAYQIKNTLLGIVTWHAKEFQKTSKYKVYDLLSCPAYTEFLKSELKKSGLFNIGHVDAALKILLHEIKSDAEIRRKILVKLDESELIAAVKNSSQSPAHSIGMFSNTGKELEEQEQETRKPPLSSRRKSRSTSRL